MTLRVLVTGASGFIGSALVSRLAENSFLVTAAYRENDDFVHTYDNVKPVCVGNIDSETNWANALTGVDCVIHCAALVHTMTRENSDLLNLYRKVNVHGTAELARQAASSGVKRFIFVSSVKVNGERTHPNKHFRPEDMPNPEDEYGISKVEAEVALKKVSQSFDMDTVVIRPPLVYGPGVKGNFSALMTMAEKNLPLPLGAIYNKRSMVSLDNLVSLIGVCISHPNAANQTFLVSDDQDVSTTQLLKLMTRAVGKKPRLLPLPMSWLTFSARVLGKKAVADRLCGSLQVDISHTKKTLGWVPPISVEEGIQRCFQQGE